MRQLECDLGRDEASPSPASSSSSLSPAQHRGELLLNVAHLEADMQTMFDDFVQYDLSEWLDVALLAFSWHEYENRAIANFL